MLKFTDTAISRIEEYLELQKAQGVKAVRVAGNAAEPRLWLAKPDDLEATDQIFKVASFDVFIDPISAGQLEGATVDFVDEVIASGFRVYFPSPVWDDAITQQAQDILDKNVNPSIASHGGRVSIHKREGETLYIEMEGGCQGCGMSQVTLNQGIETAVLKSIPEIKQIIDITDHESGKNPYYTTDAQGDSPLA